MDTLQSHKALRIKQGNSLFFGGGVHNTNLLTNRLCPVALVHRALCDWESICDELDFFKSPSREIRHVEEDDTLCS
jgi:hypothetical protein